MFAWCPNTRYSLCHMCTIFCLEVLVKSFFSGGNEGERNCVSTGCFCVPNSSCSEGIYEFYSPVTLASYAVGVQPDVKIIVVEVVE